LRGRYEEAQKEVTQALEICPNYAIVLTLEGALKVQGKEYTEAAQQFQQAINTDPMLGAAYFGLGQTYNMLGRFKEALVPLTRVVAILPAAWGPHFEKVLAHLGAQEPEAALEEITRAERTGDPDQQRRSMLSYLRAHACLQRNHYRDARTTLEEAVKQYPKGDVARLAQRSLEQLSARSSDGR
jgi:tetratricopeptide (TPR) repeat protein